MVTKDNPIKTIDIEQLKNQINSYLRNQSSLTYSIPGYGSIVDNEIYYQSANKVENINNDHYYSCGSVVTHNGGSPISLTSNKNNFDGGDMISASTFNAIGTDHTSLSNQCDCDAFTCSCETGNCSSHCSCNSECSCENECGCYGYSACDCDGGYCSCDGVCTSVCNCNATYCSCYGVSCPSDACHGYCSCHAQCNTQCSAHVWCSCDGYSGCTNYGAHCTTDCSCDSVCSCETESCTCNDVCNCEYGG